MQMISAQAAVSVKKCATARISRFKESRNGEISVHNAWHAFTIVRLGLFNMGRVQKKKDDIPIPT